MKNDKEKKRDSKYIKKMFPIDKNNVKSNTNKEGGLRN
jgi:hypothetical protein